MKKIVCIGSSAKDIFFPTDEGVRMDTPEDLTSQKKIAFESGAKYHIETRFESLGGCAVNVACGLKRLGIESFCYTVLGDDLLGEWIRGEMKKEGIDIRLVKTESCLTGLSAIIVDKRNGERIIFSNQEANKRLKVIPTEIAEFGWISVTDPNGDWRGVLDTVAEVSAETGAKICFNPRGRNITEDVGKIYQFAGKTEVLFVNKDEAIEIILNAGKNNFKDEEINDEVFLLKELKKTGAKVVVITDGEKGAWGYDGEDIFYVEALKVAAVDSTGAGDSFSSGFLAGYIEGKSVAESLKMGIINGANVVLYYGGVEGLLKKDEMEKTLNKIEAKKLN
ncbi:MAG: carbohydrate kinase family protein [Candidatus Moraniibacteriota bacterium]